MKADTEVTVEKHRIRFETLDRKSAVHAVGLGVEHYGGHISLALTSQMLGELGRGGHQIPCPFLFTSIIAVLDSASERVKAEGHRMRALQMSHTPVSQISPWYPEKARQWTIAVAWRNSTSSLHLRDLRPRPFTPPSPLHARRAWT